MSPAKSAKTVEMKVKDFLRSSADLDASPEKVFDDLAWLAAQICCAPIAVVCIVGERGQRLKAKVGLTLQEATRELPLCEETLAQRKRYLVTDLLQKERLKESAAMANSAKVRFFVGVPLVTSDGIPLGTLSVMDRVPRRLSPEQLYALEVLARQLVHQLELRQSAQQSWN